MREFICSICDYVYKESIPPGIKWEDLPSDFSCPVCGAPKTVFRQIEETVYEVEPSFISSEQSSGELSYGEISAIFSNLAKGCEKQRLNAEMEAFYKIADYFKAKSAEKGKALKEAAELLGQDLSLKYPEANKAAKENADRGALRSLVWSEKVSLMCKTLLERYAKEGDAMLANTKIYVCDICGFIHLGDELPDICPVCKVPKFKMIQVERR